MSSERDYWDECLSCAFDEAGAFPLFEQLSKEQRTQIAAVFEGAHESYGMAFYQPPSPEPSEIRRLEAELRKERSKIGCQPCGGTGRLRFNAGPWGVNTQCDKCRGEGKVLP